MGGIRNLFVVSHNNQLYHANKVACLFQGDDNVLLVLFMSKNLKMRDMIIENVRYDIFNRVETLELHKRSNNFDTKVLMHNKKIYNNILELICPDKLFLCSYEAHYAILCKLAYEKGVSVNLFEEGQASYKGLVPGYESFSLPPLRTQVFKAFRDAWKESRIATYMFGLGKFVYVEIYRIFESIYKTLEYTRRIPTLQKNLLLHKFPEYVLGWHEFDAVYSYFPEITRNVFTAQYYHKIELSFDDPETVSVAEEIVYKYNIDERTAIFAAQHYAVPEHEYLVAIASSLQEIAKKRGWRIVVKLHPKQQAKSLDKYKKYIESESIVIMEEIIECPVEYIAYWSSSPAIIALTSSALLYLPHIKDGVESISIAESVLKQLDKNGRYSSGREALRKHIKIVKAMAEINSTVFFK